MLHRLLEDPGIPGATAEEPLRCPVLQRLQALLLQVQKPRVRLQVQ